MEELVSYAKRRGFVFQASEIYGGIAGFWDYGPYGIELVNNLKAQWWKAFVQEPINVYGIDSAIIQNPKLWEASGLPYAKLLDELIHLAIERHTEKNKLKTSFEVD